MSLGGIHSIDGYTDAIGIIWRDFPMSKSIEQQVADILDRFWASRERTLSELQRAGLLATERDVLCRRLADAMEAYAKQPMNTMTHRRLLLSDGSPEHLKVCEAWSALAAYDREHAPKPRYYADGNGAYDGNYSPPRVCIYAGPSPEHAAAVAAALNALAEKEAGR